ncbi:MAG: YihY family inner membrane protein [Myxococcales bacterium]|nr:MAG: YihY family inner membrane protein [Myxococcales bacterium]
MTRNRRFVAKVDTLLDALRQNIAGTAARWRVRFKAAFIDWAWREPPDDSPTRRRARRAVRFTLLLTTGFLRHRLLVHASALTYTTLLSLLPLAAVALALLATTDLWDLDRLRELIAAKFPEFEPLARPALDLLAKTDFNSLGAAGTAFLALGVLSMMGKIEAAFNDIWAVRHQRFIVKRLFVYTAIIAATSVLAAAAWAIMALSSDAAARLGATLALPFAEWSERLTLAATIAVLGAGLTVLLTYLPNTRVPLWAGAAGGFAASAGYVLVSEAYFGLQIGMANYNLVYSSLAALPITVIWIDISWAIVLFGAELSYRLATFARHSRESFDARLRSGFWEEAALRIAVTLAAEGGTGLTLDALARRLMLPTELSADLVDRLVLADVIEAVGKGRIAVLPETARAVRLHDVIQAVRGQVAIEGHDSPALADYLHRLAVAGATLEENLTLAQAAGVADRG